MNVFRRMLAAYRAWKADRKIAAAQDQNICVDAGAGTRKPVSETESGKLFRQLAKGCPDCGGRDFLEGPSGGISTNIFCANRECRSGFNITPMIGIAERIGKGDERYYPAEVSDGKVS